MRTPVLSLALGLLVGCSPPPPEVSSGGSTTDSPPTSTSTPAEDTTAGTSNGTMTAGNGEVCPPAPPEDGGYDPCPGLCGGGGQCFNDPGEHAVCIRGCFMDCDCWPAPAGDGNAPARCSDRLLESTSVCVLDCSGGESCPRGMICVPELEICSHPSPGTETTEPGGSSSDGGSTDEGTSSGGTTDGGTSSGSTDTDTSGTTGTDTGAATSSDTGDSGVATTDSGVVTGSSSGDEPATGTSTT